MSTINSPSKYVPLQQSRPISKCARCQCDLIFGGNYCVECSVIIREQERKTERAMRESFCPFCRKLLAKHKEDEAQLCLYNLRGYVGDLST